MKIDRDSKLTRRNRSRWWCCYALSLTLLAGCCSQCGQVRCNDCGTIPDGAIPETLGNKTCNWQSTQAALAEADDFVVYQNEWRGKSAELGPFGQRHMARLLTRLKDQPNAIVIEPSEDMELNNTRRASMVQLLDSYGYSDAEYMVRLGYGAAEGLLGQEAPRLERQILRGGFGGRGGGFGGGGFGGGGGGFGGGGGGFGGGGGGFQ